jgi:hypothetical protein
MARYRSSRRRGSSYSGGSSSIGREMAMQHIEDARLLTVELGGTDQDVKQYFFSLPDDRLARILQLYGERFGEKARDYAADTIPRWRTGSVKMSGTVAERLYSLLPPLMPLRDKYQLTESLWKHVGPKTHKTLKIGIDADPDQIVSVVRDHAAATVQAYYIGDSLAKRFNWLSAGDVHVRQQLLNHLLDLETRLAEEGVRTELPVLMDHMRKHGSVTTHLQRTIQIGGHRIDLQFTGIASGLSLEDPKPSWSSGSDARGSGGTWFWWLVAAAIVVGFFLLR